MKIKKIILVTLIFLWLGIPIGKLVALSGIFSSLEKIDAFSGNYILYGQDAEFGETKVVFKDGKLSINDIASAELKILTYFTESTGSVFVEVFISTVQQVTPLSQSHNKGSYWYGNKVNLGKKVGFFEIKGNGSPVGVWQPEEFDVTSYITEHISSEYYIAIRNDSDVGISVHNIGLTLRDEITTENVDKVPTKEITKEDNTTQITQTTQACLYTHRPDDCYLELAKETQDEQICDNAGFYREDCYTELAIIKGDIELCKKVFIESECYRSVVISFLFPGAFLLSIWIAINILVLFLAIVIFLKYKHRFLLWAASVGVFIFSIASIINILFLWISSSPDAIIYLGPFFPIYYCSALLAFLLTGDNMFLLKYVFATASWLLFLANGFVIGALIGWIWRALSRWRRLRIALFIIFTCISIGLLLVIAVYMLAAIAHS